MHWAIVAALQLWCANAVMHCEARGRESLSRGSVDIAQEWGPSGEPAIDVGDVKAEVLKPAKRR